MCCAGCPGSPASAGPSGHSLRGMATLGLPALPPLTGTSVVTQVRLDPLLALMLVLSAGLYLYGVHVLRVRGDPWPVARTLLFLVPGLGSIAVATMSGLAAYDDVLLSVHMVQHMVLAMIAPIFLALGAPVTLALRTLPVRPRRTLVAALHSRAARILAFPLVAYVLFVANPFVLYFTGLYRLTLAHTWLHEVVSVTMLAVLVIQWMRDADREARRVDRKLELSRVPAPSADGGDDWEVPWWEQPGPVRSAGTEEREA